MLHKGNQTMEKKSITPKIKNGTICTLIGNENTVFRLIGKNYKLGYPYADIVMFQGRFTCMGGAQTVAYTNEWKEASDEQKKHWYEEYKKVTGKDWE